MPSLPIPSLDWDLTGILRGVKQGFERGPYGQAYARANPIRFVRDFTGLALARGNPAVPRVALTNPVRDKTGLANGESVVEQIMDQKGGGTKLPKEAVSAVLLSVFGPEQIYALKIFKVNFTLLEI